MMSDYYFKYDASHLQEVQFHPDGSIKCVFLDQQGARKQWLVDGSEVEKMGAGILRKAIAVSYLVATGEAAGTVVWRDAETNGLSEVVA